MFIRVGTDYPILDNTYPPSAYYLDPIEGTVLDSP